MLTNEQRRSESYLPSVISLLRIAFHSSLLQSTIICQQLIKVYDWVILMDIYYFKICQPFYKLAQSNVLIGLALSDRLHKSILIIDQTWIDLLVDLCLFGPVPRRDERLLCCAFYRCYTSSSELFPNRFDV